VTWFEVLVEGGADVPAAREVLTRKFGLIENTNFRIHPHKGIGKLPQNPLAKPDPKHQGLFDQLPAKLRGFSYLGDDVCVVVLADVDNSPCHNLLADLKQMLSQLPERPARVLFRLAIEETESWFIADGVALKRAFPKAKLSKLPSKPDQIIGAAEKLAEALGHTDRISGPDKYRWAEQIAPFLNLDAPPSPSFRKFIEGIERNL
jgi:hypothetical protein